MTDTRHTVEKQRHIQQQQNHKDKQDRGQTEPVTHAVQRPGSDYPTTPLPRQQQTKPGKDSALVPLASYQNPRYLGSEKLRP